MPTNEQPLSPLQKRILDAENVRKQARDQKASARGRLPTEAIAMVGRIATEMVAGIAVGGFLGWMIDTWLETTPLFMIILFFLGSLAGMMNIWRMANGYGLKVGYFDHKDEQNKRTHR